MADVEGLQAVNVRLTYITGLLDGVRTDLGELKRELRQRIEQVDDELQEHREWVVGNLHRVDVDLERVRGAETAFERLVPSGEHTTLMQGVAELIRWRKDHDRKHDSEDRSRRWLITTAVALAAVAVSLAGAAVYYALHTY